MGKEGFEEEESEEVTPQLVMVQTPKKKVFCLRELDLPEIVKKWRACTIKFFYGTNEFRILISWRVQQCQ